MTGRRQLEFFLLRYVPDAVKDEFVNIGVVMIEAGDHRCRLCRCAIYAGLEAGAVFGSATLMLRCWRRWSGRFAGNWRRRMIVTVLLRRLEDSFSNVIQLSPAKGCLAEDPVAEMETMASIYLETVKSCGKRVASGRQRILGRMRDAFEQAGIAKFLLPVPVAPYTKPGDPFQFDFGYRVGG